MKDAIRVTYLHISTTISDYKIISKFTCIYRYINININIYIYI